MYAAFLEKALAIFHTPEGQPRFEVILFDSANNRLAYGYNEVVAGDSAGCPNTANFHKGGYDALHVADYYYCDWTTVNLDMSAFIGQPVSVEFRTSDCFPSSMTLLSVKYVACPSGTCTVTTATYANGTVCTDTCDSSGNCSPISCNGTLPCIHNSAGFHGAYAYIDAYCSPISDIKELEGDMAISISPNPVHTAFTVTFNNSKLQTLNSKLFIFDILGREVLSKTLSNNKTEIERGDLESGVYMVKVRDGVREFAKKLVIE
jgi:hypothetical protein